MENTLRWNGRAIEGSYKGYELNRTSAYQFPLYEGGKIVTVTWTGTVDGQDNEPIFRLVDGLYRYTARVAPWFLSLADAHDCDEIAQARR